MLKKGRFKVQNGNFEVRFLKSPITLEAHICTSLVSNIVKQTLKAVFGFFLITFESLSLGIRKLGGEEGVNFNPNIFWVGKK